MKIINTLFFSICFLGSLNSFTISVINFSDNLVEVKHSFGDKDKFRTLKSHEGFSFDSCSEGISINQLIIFQKIVSKVNYISRWYKSEVIHPSGECEYKKGYLCCHIYNKGYVIEVYETIEKLFEALNKEKIGFEIENVMENIMEEIRKALIKKINWV